MSLIWSGFCVAQEGAGCISSPSSSPPSKMFMCRKKIAKMWVQLQGKGCEITEYLLEHLEYDQGRGQTMHSDSVRPIAGLARSGLQF